MTLIVKIKNDGNQPGDAVRICGMVQLEHNGHVEMTGDNEDSIVLLQGEEISVCPPNGHFDDPVILTMKGSH